MLQGTCAENFTQGFDEPSLGTPTEQGQSHLSGSDTDPARPPGRCDSCWASFPALGKYQHNGKHTSRETEGFCHSTCTPWSSQAQPHTRNSLSSLILWPSEVSPDFQIYCRLFFLAGRLNLLDQIEFPSWAAKVWGKALQAKSVHLRFKFVLQYLMTNHPLFHSDGLPRCHFKPKNSKMPQRKTQIKNSARQQNCKGLFAPQDLRRRTRDRKEMAT